MPLASQPMQGSTRSVRDSDFQPPCSAVVEDGWAERRWAQPLEEKCVCTCMPQGSDYDLWGAGTEGAPVIECSVAFL